MNKEKIIAKLWDYSRNEENVGEDFLDFMKEYKSITNKIKEEFKPKDEEELKQIALSVHSAYTQKQMAQSSKTMNFLTLVLILTTITTVIISLRGTSVAEKFVSTVFDVSLIIVLVALAIGILAFLFNLLRKFVKWKISKQNHIWCSDCGRIIWEYGKKGNKKSAYKRCPDCLSKKRKHG